MRSSWRNAENIETAPTAADTLVFNGNVNNTSKADIGAITRVFMAPTYTGTIQLQNNITIKTLDQHAGTIEGNFGLAIKDNWNWDGGTMKGNGDPNASFTTVFAAANFEKNLTLNGRVIKNKAVTQWITAANQPMTITISNGGEFINETTGTLRSIGADTATFAGAGAYFNYGLMETENASTMTIAVPTTFYAGQISSNGTLNFNGTSTFLGSETAGGTGQIRFNNNAVSISGSLAVAFGGVNTIFTNAPLGISGKLQLTNLGAHAINSPLTVNGAAAELVAVAGTLTFTDVALQAGRMKLGASASWTSGNINLAAGTMLENAGVLTMGGNGGRTISGSGTFLNSGSLNSNMTGGDVNLPLNFFNPGMLFLRSGNTVFSASWTLEANGILVYDGSASLQVNGAFTNNGRIGIGLEAFNTPTRAEIIADKVSNSGIILYRMVPPHIQNWQEVRFEGDSLRIRRRPGLQTGGNFHQTAMGILAMNLFDNSTELVVRGCDWLQVDGSALVGGALHLDVHNSLNLTTVLPNQEYFLIQADSVVNEFATVQKPGWVSAPQYYGTSVWVVGRPTNWAGTPVSLSDLSLASSAVVSQFGSTLTITASVSASEPSEYVPTGNVSFYLGGTPLGSIPLDSSGNAKLELDDLAIGSHELSVHYAGDDNFNLSAATISESIIGLTTSITLTLSENSVAYGDIVSLTADVTSVSNDGTPTGIVLFHDENGNLIGSATLDTSGSASVQVSLSVGSHTVFATYGGDEYYYPSSSTGQFTVGGSIGDFVWADDNADGIQDPTELGLSGVIVNLYDGFGILLASTVTDSAGQYLFAGLAAGSYRIQVEAPTGYLYSPADQGENDEADSDVDSSGVTDPFALALNGFVSDMDAGLYANIVNNS